MGRPAPRVRGADPARVAALIADRKAALDAGADHFAMLGIEPDAPVEAVRAAYFELARHLHPDRLAAAGVGDDKREAHRVFARINEAFGVLSDPDRRAEYGRVLAAGGVAVVQRRRAAASWRAWRPTREMPPHVPRGTCRRAPRRPRRTRARPAP
jgi:curved DNA-binding protein CbpA